MLKGNVQRAVISLLANEELLNLGRGAAAPGLSVKQTRQYSKHTSSDFRYRRVAACVLSVLQRRRMLHPDTLVVQHIYSQRLLEGKAVIIEGQHLRGETHTLICAGRLQQLCCQRTEILRLGFSSTGGIQQPLWLGNRSRLYARIIRPLKKTSWPAV